MKLKPWLAATAALCTCAAHAQSAGTVELGAGWMHFAPQASSDPLTVTTGGNRFIGPHSFSLPNSAAAVPGSDTLGVSLTYFVTDHIAPEFVLGIPPKFDLNGAGSLDALGRLGTVKLWSPTLLIKYYFGGAQSKLRPYVGLGVARVWFTNATVTNPELSSMLLSGPVSVGSVQDAWAPVYNVGLAYRFSRHWVAGLSVSYIPLKTTVTLDSTSRLLGAEQATSHIKLNPIVSYLNIAYLF
jgi:outer membrane protein